MKKYRIKINFKIPLVVKKVIESKNSKEAMAKAQSLAFGYADAVGWDVEVIPYIKKTYYKPKKKS